MAEHAPQNIEAEQAVLGAAILNPQALGRVRQRLTADDFYRPGHGHVFTALCALADAEQPIDALTVAAELNRTGTLTKAGGHAYLHSLVADVPTASNASYYAEMVAEASLRRKVLVAAAKLQQAAYAESWVSTEAGVDSLQGLIAMQSVQLGVLADERASAEPVTDLHTWQEFIRRPQQPENWIVPGLIARQDVQMVLGGEGSGKALALDTPILTTRGWLTMADVKPGDEVFSPAGIPVEVVAVTSVMKDRECYRVRFNDGAEIVADAQHQWFTQDYAERMGKRRDSRGGVRTTAEIACSVRARGGHTVNHSIAVAEPLRYPSAALPVPPYTLGAWLGDGTSNSGAITSADPEILDYIRRDGFELTRWPSAPYAWLITTNADRRERIATGLRLIASGRSIRQSEQYAGLGRGSLNPLAAAASGPGRAVTATEARERWLPFVQQLRNLGVLKNKHIPRTYLCASVEQRTALLQGLMDTDGSVSDARGIGRGSGASRAEITLTNQRLALDVIELIRGLGYRASIAESRATLNGKDCGPRWRMAFQPRPDAFRLSRKKERVVWPLRTQRSLRRYIESVTPVEPVPVRCIQVASADGLYLAGETLIVTHNSFVSRQAAMCVAAGIHPFRWSEQITPRRTLNVDLEVADTTLQEEGGDLFHKVRRLAPGWDGECAYVWHHPEGLNLRQARDATELERRIADCRPDFVTLGSLYNAYLPGGDSAEQVAGELRGLFNRLRIRYGFALVLEHHMPQTDQAGNRPNRPYGSVQWAGWVTHGKVLKYVNDTTYEIGKFRNDRGARDWPVGIYRGGRLPVSPIWDQGELELLRDASS